RLPTAEFAEKIGLGDRHAVALSDAGTRSPKQPTPRNEVSKSRNKNRSMNNRRSSHPSPTIKHQLRRRRPASERQCQAGCGTRFGCVTKVGVPGAIPMAGGAVNNA